jgi:hypothetical protein
MDVMEGEESVCPRLHSGTKTSTQWRSVGSAANGRDGEVRETVDSYKG